MVGGILENQKKDITGNSFFLKKITGDFLTYRLVICNPILVRGMSWMAILVVLDLDRLESSL